MHQFIYRFHKYILIFTVFLTLIAIIFTRRLKLDLNLFSLLPSDNPNVHTFFEITEEIGLQSILIALVEMPPDNDRRESESLVDFLAKNFAQSPLRRRQKTNSHPWPAPPLRATCSWSLTTEARTQAPMNF